MSSIPKKKRELPDWLKTDFPMVTPAEQCTVRVTRLEMTESQRILCELKNIEADCIALVLDNKQMQTPSPPPKRYKTRSSVTANTAISISSYEINERPKALPRPKPAFIDYNGKVEYHTEMHDIAFNSDKLLNWVNEQVTDEMIPIGFDMEWPFTFVTGPGRTAVIQLCADIDLCYVFHIHHLKKLPTALVLLLTHDKVCLHGVNIKNDCRKLERDFPEINAQKMIDQCIDLGVYCNRVWNTGGRWSMERLVWQICRLKINKDKKVRNSKWHIMPLSQEQQIYAAIDVYISQVMYIKLRQREIEKENEAKNFIEEFGQEAYAVAEKLKI